MMSGLKGARRENDSNLCVRVAARRAPSVAPSTILHDIHVALRHTPLGHVERAYNDGKHIVEVVGYAARQLTDRLHLLGMSQLSFGGLAGFRLRNQIRIRLRELSRPRFDPLLQITI